MDKNAKAEKHFDTVVIGGGAAGMMAAVVASQNGARVVLVEKNKTLGKKLLLTGNGRCNLTHASHNAREFIEKLGRNGKFLFSSLSAFDPRETIGFFENLGLRLKTEKGGRVFPTSNRSRDVLDIFLKALKESGVKVMTNQNVLDIRIKDKKVECVKLTDGNIYADNFILSTGGKSYPATGSTGDGYKWLEDIGHKITLPAPALTPIKIKESWVKDLKGLSLSNIAISFIQNGHKKSVGAGEIIFTHFGLSGPTIINASKHIGENLKKGEVILEIDLLPLLSISQLEEKLKIAYETNQKRTLKNYLSEIFPQRLATKLMGLAGIELDRKINSLSKSERISLARLIKHLPMTVESLLDFNLAMITSGGVSLKEVDPKTMRSRIVDNLYLAGEILDLDGPTGGYNLQIAWTTGHTAGTSARENV